MSRRRSKPPSQTPGVQVCSFCGFSEDNEIEYGKLLNHDGIVTHYFCLLLSSNMEQNGNDNEGILGFLVSDIQKEVRRGKRLFCTYCKRSGATLGCCNTRCKNVFHLPCGLQAGSLHQFFGEFRSFCVRHRVTQEIDEHIKEEALTGGTVTCYICYDEVNPQNTLRTLWAPCCRKNAWFHRNCVQHLALSAGYFFKCPLCNNKEEFQKAMLEHGIFIPHQDASWELVPNAFQELLHRHNSCDAEKCLCPKGRTHIGINAKWELVLCRLCGSQGIHKACGNLKWASSIWECAECTSMLEKPDTAALAVRSEPKKVRNETSIEESSSDSEISVGRNPSPLSMIQQEDLLPLITSAVKLRPGPKSFKLQQAALSIKSMELSTRETPGISSSANLDTLSCNGLDTSSNSHSNERHDYTKKIAFNSNSKESKVVQEITQVESAKPKCHTAEVIVIDSDDEVEIIDVQPRHNVLTTRTGTKIEIHNLSLAPVTSQKIEGDVKVDESRQLESSNVSHCQSKKISTLNDSTRSDRSNVLNTPATTSTLTQTIQRQPSLSKSPNARTNTMNLTKRGASENKQNPDLIITSEFLKENSVMNLKITNITSLDPEDFANSLQELSEDNNVESDTVVSIEDVQSDLLSCDNPNEVQSFQITDPAIHPPKSQTACFDHSQNQIKDLIVKRKSREFIIDNTVANFPNKALERHKKIRFCESEKSSSLPQNINISWNTNSNDIDGCIPILETSIPTTCSSKSKKFVQRTKKSLPENINISQTSSDQDIRLIYDEDIENKNGFCKYPSGATSMNSDRFHTNNDATLVCIQNSKISQIRLQRNSTDITQVPNASTPVQSELEVQHSVKNMALYNTISKNSYDLVRQETLIPPALNFYAIQRDVKRHDNSIQTLQSNSSMSAEDYSNNISKSYVKTANSRNENEIDLNSMSGSDNSITQLSNGTQTISVCDGDAGSSPADDAGLTRHAAWKRPTHATTEPVTFKYQSGTTSEKQPRVSDNSTGSIYVSTIPTIQYNSSLSTARRYCDKSGLIPEKVPLRDLQFRLLDCKIVEMVLYDTTIVNMLADSGNFQKGLEVWNSKGSTETQELPLTPAQCLKSPLSLKFHKTRNNRNVSITKECDSILSNNQRCKNITMNSMKLKPLVENLRDHTASEHMSTDDDVQGTATTIIGNDNKESFDFDKKYKKRSNVSNVITNQEIKSNDKNSLNTQHKLNNYYSSNVCEQIDSLTTIEKCKNLNSKHLEKTSVDMDQDPSDRGRVPSPDSRDKTLKYPSSVNDPKLLNEFSKGSKYSIKNSQDSVELNLPVNCYNNFNKILDCRPELSCNINDTDVHNLLINNCNGIAESPLETGTDKVFGSFNRKKSDKYYDKSNSSDLNFQVINTSYNSNTFGVTSYESTNIVPHNTFVKKQNNNITFKSQLSSCKYKNVCAPKSSVHKQTSGIKVRISLKKIQNLIDSKPQLFNKYNRAKSKRKKEHESEIVPISAKPQSLHNSKINKNSHVRMTQSSDIAQDVDDSNVRKRFKYDFQFFKEHSKS